MQHPRDASLLNARGSVEACLCVGGCRRTTDTPWQRSVLAKRARLLTLAAGEHGRGQEEAGEPGARATAQPASQLAERPMEKLGGTLTGARLIGGRATRTPVQTATRPHCAVSLASRNM